MNKGLLKVNPKLIHDTTVVGKTIGHDATVVGKAIGHDATVVGKAIGHGATVAAHAISEGAKIAEHRFVDGVHTFSKDAHALNDAIAYALTPLVGPGQFDLVPDIGGVVSNSISAIGSFAKALCQIIDLGVEIGETALDPNAPLHDPLPC